jgi:hypothetical protein
MMSLRASVLCERSNLLPTGDCFAKERLAMTTLWQAQVSTLCAAQAETEKELSALIPSILDKAFKGEL